MFHLRLLLKPRNGLPDTIASLHVSSHLKIRVWAWFPPELSSRLYLTVWCSAIDIRSIKIHTSYHTYINGHYNPSARIIDLVSHTPYFVCVNFTHKWWNLQFKVDSKRQISQKLFHGNCRINILSNFIFSDQWFQPRPYV